eukprot:3537031-Rhodomonas_salina.1
MQLRPVVPAWVCRYQRRLVPAWGPDLVEGVVHVLLVRLVAVLGPRDRGSGAVVGVVEALLAARDVLEAGNGVHVRGHQRPRLHHEEQLRRLELHEATVVLERRRLRQRRVAAVHVELRAEPPAQDLVDHALLAAPVRDHAQHCKLQAVRLDVALAVPQRGLSGRGVLEGICRHFDDVAVVLDADVIDLLLRHDAPRLQLVEVAVLLWCALCSGVRSTQSLEGLKQRLCVRQIPLPVQLHVVVVCQLLRHLNIRLLYRPVR